MATDSSITRCASTALLTLAALNPFPAWAEEADEADDRAPATVAAEPAAPAAHDPFADTMTGDWGGLRTRLQQDGFNFHADYVSETFAVVDGGIDHGTAYTQQVRAGVDFDMERIAGWDGAKFHVTVNDRMGKSASVKFVGNRMPIQEAYGGQYTRLTELSYEQDLLDDRLNLRLGYFAMGNDLGGSPVGCNFVNAAYCAHALSLSGNSDWFNYPNARWGAAIRYKMLPDVTLRTGVYQVNPRLGERDNAWDPFAGGTKGVLVPMELEYDPGNKAGSRVLPGHYKLGAYIDTANANRQGVPGRVGERYGAYAIADQMIWRDGPDGRALSLFGVFTINPRASAQITRWYSAGLVMTGTFRGREADTLALGAVRASVNPNLRRAHLDVAPTPGDYGSMAAGETTVELAYGIQATRWLMIRLDMQYIFDPGAFSYRSTDDALALGGQVKIQF